MRRRHLHLTALVFHHSAAGAFLSAHLRVGNHAGYCWSQAGYQQQDQHTELAKRAHFPLSDYAYMDNESNQSLPPGPWEEISKLI
jgi:hypothetical protein